MVGGRLRRIVAKGQAVGDVLFTRLVMEVAGRERLNLKDLCFAAYDAARRESHDLAAMNLMRTIVMIDEPISASVH